MSLLPCSQLRQAQQTGNQIGNLIKDRGKFRKIRGTTLGQNKQTIKTNKQETKNNNQTGEKSMGHLVAIIMMLNRDGAAEM